MNQGNKKNQQQQSKKQQRQPQKDISTSTSTSTTSTSTTGKRQLQHQQGKPSETKRSKNMTSFLFQNSYASFEEIPENIRTQERDFYLIYFNVLNESWWYYPSLLIENDQMRRLGPLGGTINLEHFPYHESAVYFFLWRDDLYAVDVSVQHEIRTIIMGMLPLTPRQRSYKLTFHTVPEVNTAYEFMNNKYSETYDTRIQKFAELLLPFENVRQDQRERQRVARLRQQRERQNRRARIQRQTTQRLALLRQRGRQQANKIVKKINPQGD